MKRLAIIGLFSLVTVPAAAPSATIITAINADLAQGGYSFTYLKNIFGFAATGDIFNPLAVQNVAPAATGSFGGFLGIPVSPTSSFTDRGTVTFGPLNSYATFLTPTTVPFSNGSNFIGLRATYRGQDYFGFAYTTDARLNSIGFETVAGQTITATTAIPEASAWAMMVMGLGIAGAFQRGRRPARVAA